MKPLQSDETGFLTAEDFGDFFPGLAPLALFADETFPHSTRNREIAIHIQSTASRNRATRVYIRVSINKYHIEQIP